jgi:hypothetical protein
MDWAPLADEATFEELLLFEVRSACPEEYRIPRARLAWNPIRLRIVTLRKGARRAVRKALTVARRIGYGDRRLRSISEGRRQETLGEEQ